METHTHEVNAQLDCSLDQLYRRLHISAEFHAKSTHGILVVCDDSQDTFGVRMILFDLVELVLVVESHVLDAYLMRISNIRGLLARIGKYDAMRGNTQVEHSLDLVLARTVKASAQEGEQLEQHAVRVAFDGIMGLDTRQTCYPVYVLVAYVFEVNNVKWIFLDILMIRRYNAFYYL